jgi:hypothetical protein
MGKQNNTPTKVSQEQYTKDLDESVLKLINAGADDEVVKSYMKDYSARYVVEKKNDIASSTSTSTPKESPTQTRVGGTLSAGGKRMITPPSDISGSPKKTPRATKEELSTWDKSFKEKKPKQQTLKEVITPFGQTAIEDIKLSTPSTLEAQREERIIKEANNINKEEVDKLVNDEVNNKQFTDGLREGIKSTVNLVATPIYQYFTDSKEEFLKPYVPLEQELKEVEEAYKNSSIKLTEEQKKQEATKLYREKKEAEIRISNLDRFINNSPKEFRETQSRMKLNELTKRAVMTDRVRQDANYLVSSEDILLNTPKEIEGLNNRVKESLKKGDTITADNLIAEIEDKEKLFLDTAKTVNVIVNRYDENLKDLKDTEAKIDYLKFNYNTEGKLLDDLYSTSLQIIGGGIKLAAETAFDTRVNEPAKFIADIGSSMIDSAEKQIVDRRNITIDQVNSPRDLGLWTAQLFTRQAPILASMYFGGQGGLALVSTGSGGQKFREMEKEEEQIFGKKYSFAEKWLASVGYAGLEYALEKVGTFKILNDVKKTVKSFPSAEQALFRSGVKESFDYASQVGKASAREGLTELATSLGQTEIIDIGFLDKEISQRDKINSYSEALTSGIVMGGGMVATTIPVQIMSKLVAETATRAEVQKSRELLEKMNAYAEELKKPDLTDASKKILSEKINDLTQESFDIFSKNKKDLESLSKGEIKAILEINVESQNLRDKAKSVLESNISKEIKDIEISSLQQQYDALQDKKSQIRSGVITDFDLQTNEQIIKIKDKASKELIKEAEGKDITLTDEVITERAKQIYKQQKQKQDEREVPKQEGKQPEDSSETISAEVKEDDLQPQEKVVEEGAEPVSDAPLLEKQVEDLRKEEIAELNKEVENPESFITDGKVDANKVVESDNAKAKEIYAKYDAQIKPLLDNIKTQKDAVQIESTSQVPVQSETTVSEEVEQGKPQSEPKIITEEEVKIETTSILNQVADKVIEDSKIKGKTKDSGVKTSRKMASEFILEVKKRLDYDLPNSSIINLFKELEKVSFSKGDVKDVFDKANEVLIKEVNKVYKNQKIAKSVIDKQKALKNLGAGKMGDVLKSGVVDISVRMAALNPKVVAQMSDSDIDMFSSVMSRLADNSKVTPVVDLIIARGDGFRDFYDRYQNKVLEISEKQQQINEQLDKINSLSTKEDIQSIEKEISNIVGDLDKGLFQIPSVDLLSDSEIQDRKNEREEDKKIIREVYIDLINSEKNGIDVAVSFNGSILNDIISFVEGIDNKLLESLTQSELNNLFNSILNIKQGLGGNKFINDLMVRKTSEDLSSKTIKTVNEISKPTFKNKMNNFALNLRDLRRLFDFSIGAKGIKGVTSTQQSKVNFLFENLPTEYDNLLMNQGVSLYEATGLDMLAKSDGAFISITKKFNDNIDDAFSDLIKESKDINLSQLKILYYGLNKMAMSNRLDKNIGNIIDHLKYTSINTKNSVVSKSIKDFLNYLESVRVDSTIEVIENQDGGIDVIVNIDSASGVDVVINTSEKTYKVPKDAKTFTIKNAPIDAVNNLTVENANFLVGAEKNAFDIMSKYLKEGSKYALEAMMLHNGSYLPMRNNYFPMMSSKTDGAISSNVMEMANIKHDQISTKSGNLLELRAGNKRLLTNPFSSVKTAVNGVALQHSKRNAVAISKLSNSLTESLFTRNFNQGLEQSKQARETAIALKNIVEATVAVDLGSTYAKMNGTAEQIAKGAESLFVQGALLSIPNRSVDLFSNVLNSLAAKPNFITLGVSLQKQLKKALAGDDASRVYANMKATDIDGLVYSDISSVAGANIRRRGLSGYNKLEMNDGFQNMINKQLNLLFNNPISNFLAKSKTGIIATADVITKPSLFLAEFADSFERASGSKFEIEKFVQGDPKWLFDNRKAIKEASIKANQLLNKVTTSSNPYSAVPRSAVQSTSNISFGVMKEGKSVGTEKGFLANISDKATGLFARFIRTNTSRIFSGGRKIFMEDKRREGLVDVISGVSVLGLYTSIISSLNGYLGSLFASAKLGIDDEDEKIKEEIINSLDNARKDPVLMSLLNSYNQIISDPEVSVEDREAILTELINNDSFKLVSTHVTTQHILRNFGLMSMDRAINNDGLVNSVDYDQPNLELFSSYYAYLLTEEAEKSGINTKKERDKVLSVLSTFLFDEFGSYYDNPSLTEGHQRFAMAEITAEHIKKYKTSEERLYINAIAKTGRQLLRAEAGGYGSVPIDFLMAKTNEAFTEEVLDKPYDYFSQNSELFDAAYLNDMLKDDEQGKKKRSYQSAYLYVLEQAFPKSSSQFKNIVGNDFNDDTETLINFLDYLYIFSIPGATDVKRIESAANRSEVFKIMNVKGDKLTFDILKIEKEPKDLKEKQQKDVKEKVKIPLKTGKQVKKKFGGN